MKLNWEDILLIAAVAGLALFLYFIRPSTVAQPITYNATTITTTNLTIPANAQTMSIGNQRVSVIPLGGAQLIGEVQVYGKPNLTSAPTWLTAESGVMVTSPQGYIIGPPGIYVRLIINSAIYDGIVLPYHVNATINRLSSQSALINQNGVTIYAPYNASGENINLIYVLYPGGEYTTNATQVYCTDLTHSFNASLPPSGIVPLPPGGLQCTAVYGNYSFPFNVTQGRNTIVIIHAPKRLTQISIKESKDTTYIDEFGFVTPWGRIAGTPFYILIIIIVIAAVLLDALHHKAERRRGNHAASTPRAPASPPTMSYGATVTPITPTTYSGTITVSFNA